MSIKTQAKIKLGMTAFIALTLAVGGVATLPSAEASNRHSSNAAYQTYVIHTYGGASLLPSVRQTLASYGGSASFYQDKLVLRTTPTGYQAVQNLLGQIDGVPQSLRVSVRVGQTGDQTGTIRQGQIVITNNSLAVMDDTVLIKAKPNQTTCIRCKRCREAPPKSVQAHWYHSLNLI